MDNWDILLDRRIEKLKMRLENCFYTDRHPLKAEYMKSAEPLPFAATKKGKFKPVTVGTEWGERWDCAWFRFSGRVPAAFKGKTVVALLDVGGEGCLYNDKGEPVLGLTNGAAYGDYFSKRRVQVAKRAKGGESVRLLVDGAANSLFGNHIDWSNYREKVCHATLTYAELAVFEPEAWALYNDLDWCDNWMRALPATSRHRRLLRVALNDVCNMIGEGGPATWKAARAILAPELRRRANASAAQVSAIGHAHIDVCWLWPLRETWRKTERTFSTALALMEEYPDYRFGASQPYLYEKILERHPALFKRIQQAVKKGRWELQGGMYVEADCNVIGGEAMVRQFLYGKRFYMEHFGVEVDNLWLPDVFGYSGALPQILKKAGIDYFLTQKMSWNRRNKFPHTTMWWRGIDGSEVFTHFPPAHTYNADVNPQLLAQHAENDAQAHCCDHSMMLFGIGDGGGGPGRYHIERCLRAADAEDLPKVKIEFAKDFFKKAERSARDLPVWDGELYLENHRGTLTTHGRAKRRNRKLELALRELEILYSLYAPDQYPAETLRAAWKTVLLHQFHDIIPGSSITRVYEETHADYDRVEGALRELTSTVERRIAGAIQSPAPRASVAVLNTLGFQRQEVACLPGDWTKKPLVDSEGIAAPTQKVTVDGKVATLAPVTVPPLGHAVLRAVAKADAPKPSVLKASRRALENGKLRVEFNGNGEIKRLYDKFAERELVPVGTTGNRIRTYDDRPNSFDAWDVDFFYDQTITEAPKLVKAEVLETGPVRATLRHTYKAPRYDLVQDVSLYRGSQRLEFRTEVDWREAHRFLKVAFPYDLRCTRARYEIQYGQLGRPTHGNNSWDEAQFEVCGHRWAEVAEDGYGLALLNDCKYGYKIRDGWMELSLLRAPKGPDPVADMHTHRFTYALFPYVEHQGVMIQEAHRLNTPLRAVPLRAAGQLPPLCSGFDLHTLDEDIVLEVVKEAEEGTALILRLYEATGGSRSGTLRLPEGIVAAREADLLERPGKRLAIKLDKAVGRRGIALRFRPYEIKTLRLERE